MHFIVICMLAFLLTFFRCKCILILTIIQTIYNTKTVQFIAQNVIFVTQKVLFFIYRLIYYGKKTPKTTQVIK